MKYQLQEIVDRVLSEDAKVVDVGRSPLKYHGYASKNRLALIDKDAEPSPPNYTYYTDYTRMRKFSKGRMRKRLKKPVVDEFIPGGPPGMIAFQDWSYWGDKQSIYLDYLHVRDDMRGRGHARKLIQALIDMHPDLKLLHFGKMMREEIGHLKDSFAKKYAGKINIIGARNY